MQRDVCTGTIGLAPSANLNPERSFSSLFEPVHGSAPDTFGHGVANPIAMIWSAALMLDFLTDGQGAGRAAHDAIVGAIETVLAQGPRTPDLGGRASTAELGQAIAALVDRAARRTASFDIGGGRRRPYSCSPARRARAALGQEQ